MTLLKTTLSVFALFFISISFGQSDASSLQDSPENVLNEIFRAARTGDFSNLSLFCSPEADNDGDTQSLCDMNNSSEEKKSDFKRFFRDGKITGEPVFENRNNASIDFTFGNNDRKETMFFVRVSGKWYLSSF